MNALNPSLTSDLSTLYHTRQTPSLLLDSSSVDRMTPYKPHGATANSLTGVNIASHSLNIGSFSQIAQNMGLSSIEDKLDPQTLTKNYSTMPKPSIKEKISNNWEQKTWV